MLRPLWVAVFLLTCVNTQFVTALKLTATGATISGAATSQIALGKDVIKLFASTAKLHARGRTWIAGDKHLKQ